MESRLLGIEASYIFGSITLYILGSSKDVEERQEWHLFIKLHRFSISRTYESDCWKKEGVYCLAVIPDDIDWKPILV